MKETIEGIEILYIGISIFLALGGFAFLVNGFPSITVHKHYKKKDNERI